MADDKATQLKKGMRAVPMSRLSILLCLIVYGQKHQTFIQRLPFPELFLLRSNWILSQQFGQGSLPRN